jgi:hypothetical protein
MFQVTPHCSRRPCCSWYCCCRLTNVVGVPYVPGDTTLFQASLLFLVLLLSSYYCCWRSLCSRWHHSVPGVPAVPGTVAVVLLLLLAFLMFQVTLLCSRRPCYCWRPYYCCLRSLCSRCPHSVLGVPAVAGVPLLLLAFRMFQVPPLCTRCPYCCWRPIVVVGVPYVPGAPTLFRASLLLLACCPFCCWCSCCCWRPCLLLLY